jgi:hypothetical protein
MTLNLLRDNHDPVDFFEPIHIVDVDNIANIIKQINTAGIPVEEIRTNDEYRDTLLHVIVRNGLCKHHFNENGIDIKSLKTLVLSENRQGNTPLHVAILARELGSIYALCTEVDDDIGLKEQNKDGDTPLHLIPQMHTLEELKGAISAITLYCKDRDVKFLPEFMTKNLQGKTAFELALGIDDETFHRDFYSLYACRTDPSSIINTWHQLWSLKKNVTSPRFQDFLFKSAIATVDNYCLEQKTYQENCSCNISVDQYIRDLITPYNEIKTYMDMYAQEVDMPKLIPSLMDTIECLFKTKLGDGYEAKLRSFHLFSIRQQEENENQAKKLFRTLAEAILACVRINLGLTQAKFKKEKFNETCVIVKNILSDNFYRYWGNNQCLIDLIKNGYMQDGYTVVYYLINRFEPSVHEILQEKKNKIRKERLTRLFKVLGELMDQLKTYIVTSATVPSVRIEQSEYYPSRSDIIRIITAISEKLGLTDKQGLKSESLEKVMLEMFKEEGCAYLVKQYQLSALGLDYTFLESVLEEEIEKALCQCIHRRFGRKSVNEKSALASVEEGCLAFLKWLMQKVNADSKQMTREETERGESSISLQDYIKNVKEKFVQLKDAFENRLKTFKEHEKKGKEELEKLVMKHQCCGSLLKLVEEHEEAVLTGLERFTERDLERCEGDMEEWKKGVEELKKFIDSSLWCLREEDQQEEDQQKKTNRRSSHRRRKGKQRDDFVISSPISSSSHDHSLSNNPSAFFGVSRPHGGSSLNVYQYNGQNFREVTGNSDSIYQAFGISRQEACDCLFSNRGEVFSLLELEIKAKLLESRFMDHMRDEFLPFIEAEIDRGSVSEYEIPSEMENGSFFQYVGEKLQDYAAHPIVIGAYLAVTVLSSNEQQPSMGILESLAKVKGIPLCIWNIENQMNLQPSSGLNSSNVVSGRVDLLLNDDGSFVLLKLIEPPSMSPSL